MYASLLPVQWGVVAVEDQEPDQVASGQAEKESVGHCTFTSFDVSAPVQGRLYR